MVSTNVSNSVGKKVKVVHIIIGLNVGGAELMLQRLVFAHIGEKKIKHIVISLTDQGVLSEQFRESGIEVQCLGLTSIFNVLQVFFKMCKLLQFFRPDIVQTWLYHADFLGGLAAKIIGAKSIVWNIRTTELKKGSYITSGIRKMLALLSYMIPDKIVVVAEKSKKKHIDLGYQASKMVVISNGFEIGKFDASLNKVARFKKEIRLADDELIVGCVGRFSQVKGQDVFVKATKIVLKVFPRVRFLLIGRGLDYSNHEFIHVLKKHSNINNFILLGERSDIPTCLKSMDLFCLPSRSEGFPNALGEAMLAGVSCVSTDAGDASILGGKDVPIAKAGNHEDLANKLVEVLKKSRLERKKIGRRLRQRIIDEYSLDKMACQYQDLYSDLERGWA
jgi:glycosyltransferase involved in cell wall biosynthesis